MTIATPTLAVHRAPDEVRDEIRPGRRISYSWQVETDARDATTWTAGDEPRTTWVRLSVSDDPGYRGYWSSLFVEHRTATVTTWTAQIGGPREGQRWTSATVDITHRPRYNAQRLTEHASRILMEVMAGAHDADVDLSVADILSRIPAPAL